ncbi:MAG TPA: glycosyltransferase family 39 protein [Candidatus Acidoferrales bacterium]|nr:glycosyltransferase family 39 protein [Candidatus Acidoferrales bacterium]
MTGWIPHQGAKHRPSMERPARAAFVGALIAALITLPGLGVGTLWDNSETAYGEVAREILLTHDWIVMHLNGQPWFVQPPLYFWIGALFARVFGVTSFALRLPSAIATILMGAMTGYAVARQAGTRIGVYASAILSSCLMQAIIGRLAIMDALLDMAVALNIFFWFRALEAGRDRYFIYGWIAAGFGFLAKGLVAPVAALMVIVPYAFWNGRHEDQRLPSWRGWLGGALAFLAVVAPWLIAITLRAGPHAFDRMIVHYTIGRYTGVIENQAGPIWYYLPVVILGFFPWIAFLPVGVAYGTAALRRSATPANVARLWRLAFVWIVVPLVFFSFARTKLPNYIALELPALALVVALYVDAVVVRGTSRSIVISAATVPIFVGLCAIAIALFVRDNKLSSSALAVTPYLIDMGASIAIGSIVTAVLLARRATMAAAPYVLGASMLVAIDILVIKALPLTEQFKPVPQFAKVVEARRRPGDVVAIQSFRGANALVFYTEPHVYVLAPPGARKTTEGVFARGVLCTHERIWLVAPLKRPAYDPTYGRTRTEIMSSGSGALYLVDGPPCDTVRAGHAEEVSLLWSPANPATVYNDSDLP